MPLTRKLKGLAAILLLLACLLPLSSCTVTRDGTREGSSQSTSTEYRYAWTGFDVFSAKSYVVPGLFLWPTAFFFVSRKRSSKFAVAAWWFEAPLLACSGYVIYLLTFLRAREIGGYLAYCGLALYAGAWIGEAAIRIRTQIAAHHATPAGV